MEKETIVKFSGLAKNKADFLKTSHFRYFIYSMLAGIYVGLGIILIFSIGAPLKEANVPFLKALMGVSFSIALTLVIFAGSELFTGNNMVMTIGSLEKKVTWLDTGKVWTMSFLGNLTGSLLLVGIMTGTGFLSKQPFNSFIVETSAMKMTTPFLELFFRGLLCNVLVCLAVWMSGKAKEETAKLILVFWCLFGFIGSGFEHSVANMTLLAMGIFSPHANESVNWLGFINNLIPVTLGNIVGGALFVGAAYWFVSSAKSNE
ncbi:formate/nitrite transporter family protein [Pseudobacteroides cellulosolvens]|uniref:formate/nitrite transporter family protein n=1 Tax=Pseudobacteroides cellulosolvens TaxID=35825 RepID=UPI00056A0227|nr:formate/nitrite transporter family protein [Pseudobacteroides cellulosolvens]